MKLRKFLISLATIAILACMNVFADGNLLEVRRYVDEFGDPTEEAYITQVREQGGRFSNSATTNSRISWKILVDADSVSFMIDEYGSQRVKGSIGFPDRYTVSVKDPDGEVYRFSGSNASDRIKLASDDAKLMLGLMATYDDLKIAIVELTRYSSSSYNLGTLDCTGFADLYESLFGESVWESGNALTPEDAASESFADTSANDVGGIGGDSDGSDGKDPRFSVSTLVGYAVNMNTADDLRVGLAATWRAFTEDGIGLDLRADVSVLTLLPGVYPSFDVTAGLMCVCPPIALGSTEFVFSFGTMLGYARINGAMGETYSPSISFYTIPEGGTNIFLTRFIVEAEVALDDFSIGLDLFFEMPMYSVLDTDYWGYINGSVDLGFSFIPSLAVKYRF